MTRAGAMWSAGTYDHLAERLTPIHEQVVRRLDPRPGERWLDVATGTGRVAMLAAAAGAEVTGVDIAPGLLDQARAAATDAGLGVTFDLGDAQALPYGNADFDVVSSNLGVMFAPDHAAAARELARVCRPGGRLGMTAWRPTPELDAVVAEVAPDLRRPFADVWGDEDRVEELLGGAYELTIEEHVWELRAASADDMWELMTTSAPPVKALHDMLPEADRVRLKERMLDYWRGFERDGVVVEPRRYLLILGRRR